MNWTCLVYGGPMSIIMIWWLLSARKWFNGPKVNVQHLMLGREDPENTIEGREVKSSQNGSDSENGEGVLHGKATGGGLQDGELKDGGL
ncbi:hypothetical protein LTR28_006181 [Elasticomyces elasticus]|nr:hypothetical protein LTR28_006181 [Elasticomyces elasticus]